MEIRLRAPRNFPATNPRASLALGCNDRRHPDQWRREVKVKAFASSIAIGANVAVILTFLVVAFALFFTARQLRQADGARSLQSISTIFEWFSSREEFLRRIRVTALAGKDAAKYTTDEFVDADMTGAFWQRVGVLCEAQLLDRILILRMYSLLILSTWDTLQHFLAHQRSQVTKGTGYWAGFERLAMSAELWRRDEYQEPTDRFHGTLPVAPPVANRSRKGRGY
jgi:hypothetical protein